MKVTIAVAVLAASAVIAGCGPAHAEPSSRFVSQDGYTAMDADRVWDEVNAALAPSDPESVFLPAARLAPMTLALMALEAAEPELERVRYRLRYGTDWIEASPGGGPHPISYIEVTRFNLGPEIHRELSGQPGDVPVADVEAFGVGPHVSWRLVTQPVMGNRATVVAAGRMEIEGEAAAGEACLGGDSCLQAHSGIEAAAPWGRMESIVVEPGEELPGDAGGAMTPAQAVALMLGGVDSVEADRAPDAPAIPEWAIEAVIETNIGQDLGLEGAYRQGGLLDDSVAAIWQRLASVNLGGPEPTVFRASAYECRRGSDEFAKPGEYCP